VLIVALKLAMAALEGALDVYDAARAKIKKGRAADRAFDTRRPHLWIDPQDIRGEVWCAYCKRMQTPANHYALCPATGEPPK
jgi:uncharacterized Zn-finger protein